MTLKLKKRIFFIKICNTVMSYKVTHFGKYFKKLDYSNKGNKKISIHQLHEKSLSCYF